MNSKFLVSLILGALPLTMMAQDDDMYFVPSKKSVEKPATTRTTVRGERPAPTFYSGSSRNVDEYNRRGGSYYQVVPADTAGSDIIDFNGELGVYPDSAAAEDYALTREMSRWDGYEPDAYLEGYRDGRRESAFSGWHSPWFYSSYYPWYDSYWYWNDPWYGYHGWYDPWYYGYGYYGYYRPWHHPYWYGGYYYPRYYGGGVVYHNSGPAGTERHGRVSYGGPRGMAGGRTSAYSSGSFGGRSLGSAAAGRGTFGGSRSSSAAATRSAGSNTPRRSSNAYGNFGGSRTTSSAVTRSANTNSSSSSRSYTPSVSSSSRSSGSSGSFGGGGSFGGSRSSGGGGGRSGGGSFGGRR